MPTLCLPLSLSLFQCYKWTSPDSQGDPGWLFRPSVAPTSTSRWVVVPLMMSTILLCVSANTPCELHLPFSNPLPSPPDSHWVPAGSFWWDPVAVWRTRRPDRRFRGAAAAPGLCRVLVSSESLGSQRGKVHKNLLLMEGRQKLSFDYMANQMFL